MSMRWYVVHAYSGYEKKVALAIQERIKLNNLDDRFGEILVPTEEVVEMKSGQKICAFIEAYPIIPEDIKVVRPMRYVREPDAITVA